MPYFIRTFLPDNYEALTINFGIENVKQAEKKKHWQRNTNKNNNMGIINCFIR